MASSNPITNAVATPLEYRAPSPDPDWLFSVQGAQVTLSLSGLPSWWQFITALGGLLLCGTVSLTMSLILATTSRQLGNLLLFPLISAIIFGLLALRAAARFRRLVLFGPDRKLYHLTSQPLADHAAPVKPLYDPEVIRVTDVAAAPGRLLYNGRREVLLRFIRSEGWPYDVIWRGTRADVERLADDLRQVLLLDMSSARDARLPPQ